jgi:hypothetical protein
MDVNVIQKSDFAGKAPLGRFDAEYVWKSYWNIEKKVRACDGWALSQIVLPYRGTTLNDSFSPEEASVRYVDIDSVDVADGLAYSEDLMYGDRPSRAKYRLQLGDLLISNVRPNRGAIAFVNESAVGALASSGFSLLRDKRIAGLPQAYLFAFLKSSFGRTQLERRSRGSMYPAITIDDVLSVWVPKPPDRLLDQVCNAVTHGAELQARFFKLIEEQRLFLRDFLAPIGQPPSPLEGRLFEANWTGIHRSAMDASGRIDAEFFRHEYDTFNSALKDLHSSFLLGEFYALSAGRGLGKGEETVPFIKQAVLTNAGVNWSAVAYEEGAAKSVGNVQSGDILLACTAHEIYYVGRKVDFVRDVPEEIESSNSAVADLMVLRPRPNRPKHLYGSYVAAFLRSPSGLHQVQRCIRGLRGGHVYKDDLSNYVRVPMPDKRWLERFEERAGAFEATRVEARLEIGKAYHLVEDWLGND